MFQFLDFVKRNRASILTILSLLVAVLGLCKDQIQNMPADTAPLPVPPPAAQPRFDDEEPAYPNGDSYSRDARG